MILVPRKNLYLPRRRWAGDKHKQRGTIQMAMLGINAKITLNAGNGGLISVVDSVSPYNSTVGIRFNPDGTVEKRQDINGATNWVAHGSWISPLARASSDYRVRYTGRVGSDDFTTKAALEDVFIALGSVRTWEWNKTTLNNTTFDCDFEVEDNVGPIPTASKAYTFGIENSA